MFLDIEIIRQNIARTAQASVSLKELGPSIECTYCFYLEN
jgi:hypothetical protein